MKMLSLFVFAFCFNLNLAHAAQVGQIVVDEAQIHEYPQFASKVISQMTKGQSVQVSNLPTEGFFKVRLPNGELGWVSGNDVLVGGGTSATPARAGKRYVPYTKARSYTDEASEDGEVSQPSAPGRYRDDFRFLFGFGLENLSYGGLSGAFDKVSQLNYGTNIGLEFQWKSSPSLFWAIRVDRLSTSTGDQVIANSITQNLKQTTIPILFGLNYGLSQSRSFRFGFGAYFGLAHSSMAISQIPTSGTGGENNYGSWDPCAMVTLQPSFSLGNRFSVFAEVGYRYEKASAFDSSVLGTTAMPSFAIDYSGIIGRAGLEMRF